MTITNGYCTLSEYKAYQRITSTDATDDSFIEQDIEAASRWIDRESRTQFYSTSVTRVYDTPRRQTDVLLLDAHFLTVTSLINGDGSTFDTGDYLTLPLNQTPIYGIELKDNISMGWLPTSAGNIRGAISVAGTIGFSSTTPTDIKLACMEITKALYSRRFGENMNTKTVITPAGVVQIPEGVPDWAAQTVGYYRRRGFA